MSSDLDGTITRCAERLWEARQTGRALAPVRHDLPAMDVSSAYKVQQINVARHLAAGQRIIGRKIGLTSEAVQRQLGVDQPDFGVLFDNMAYRGNTVTVPLKGLISPRIEAEIAFVLKSDIHSAGLDRASLEAAIGAVAASAEIVDSAIAAWDIDIVDTVADNASSAAFALGETQAYVPGMDLPARAMRLSRGEEVISAGTGAATLGHPLTALAWLADTAVAFGEPLRAGDIILAGALGPMKSLDAGDYVVEIDGFPTLTVKARA